MDLQNVAVVWFKRQVGISINIGKKVKGKSVSSVLTDTAVSYNSCIPQAIVSNNRGFILR